MLDALSDRTGGVGYNSHESFTTRLIEKTNYDKSIEHVLLLTLPLTDLIRSSLMLGFDDGLGLCV